MITTLRIETAHETKTITVYQADIMHHQASILCFPYYIDEFDKGDIYELIAQKACGHIHTRPILMNSRFETAVVQNDELQYIQVGAIGNTFTVAEYTQMLQMTFATITALQNEGAQYTSVALPVLFHKRIRNDYYEQYVKAFVMQLHQFLKHNEQLKDVQIYLWHDQDAKMWQKILSKSIQLREDRVEVQADRQQLVALIEQKAITNILTKQNNPLLSQLQQRKLHHSVFHNSMRLVDGLLNDLAEKNIISKTAKQLYIFKKIQLLRADKCFPEWFINYINSMQVAKEQALFLTEVEQYSFMLKLKRVVGHLLQLGVK